MSFLIPAGSRLEGVFVEVGRFFITLWRVLLWTPRRPWDWKQLLRQMVVVGIQSLPVVLLTAMFTGMVLALQTFTVLQRVGAESFVASLVSLSTVRELAPVIGGLMIAGRCGSAMGAELGTMRVTEQIDALVTLATNPFKYLVGPRIVAAVVTLPILVAIGDTIGILGGYIVGTRSLGFNGYAYIKNTADFLHFDDVTSGLIKAAVFGFIIAVMGCYHGFNSKGGAAGVGRATTNAVVSAAILILAANFALTSLLFKD